MGSMIFWRLEIVSRQKERKFNYMLIFCTGSFPSAALHILTVYNFTFNCGVCFVRMVPFSFSIGTHQRSESSFSSKWARRPIIFSLSWNWEIIFFCQTAINHILLLIKEHGTSLFISNFTFT